jgi:hypothetical protein
MWDQRYYCVQIVQTETNSLIKFPKLVFLYQVDQ